ncbi:hypothetical protein F5Y13DRAFT_116542 [Hypoxylon sp. FL1857]|nr:hypothetical protein F5Y13DRAFT_116542 [Hypoxylon sp. FL1857]
MAHCSTFHRMSVGSQDDDQFYSAPSSRLASRHASLVTAQFNLPEETNNSFLPLGPPVSISPETRNPASIRPPKPRWAVPFTMRYRHDTIHRHFCPKPLGRRLHRTFHGTSESIPLLQPLTNESNTGTNGYTTPLISIPTSPTHWGSMHTGNRSPRSERSHSSIDSLPGNPISIDKQGTDAIVRNIRTYLSNKKHNDCPSQTDILQIANENQPPSELQTSQTTAQGDHGRTSETAYLVTTSDIAGILDIVIAGIRCIHHDGSAARCLSMLLPKETLLRPILDVTAIVPGYPSIADPATTISSVRPSFSMTSCSTHHSHHHDSVRTTFISRQSITEVT